MIPEELYKQITDSLPIVGIDVIPVKNVDGELKLGAVMRATGPQKGNLAMIGGRIRHGEKIEEAINRHLETDLGIKSFKLHPSNTIERPFRVQQFNHSNDGESTFDPTKHAISLTYIIEIKGELKPQNEASDFKWLAADEIPDKIAYNHQLVLKSAMEHLSNH